MIIGSGVFPYIYPHRSWLSYIQQWMKYFSMKRKLECMGANLLSISKKKKTHIYRFVSYDHEVQTHSRMLNPNLA